MWWVVGTIANAVVAVAYVLIAGAIIRPLVRSRQLRENALGVATAAIFLTCAVHHGGHSVHMLLPSLGVDSPAGLAMRTSWQWPLAVWDVVTAVVGVWYWTLRRAYPALLRGPQLFDDPRQRERQALELNDQVLQALVVVKLALDLDQPARATAALDGAIASASSIITDLLGEQGPGGALRETAALVERPEEGRHRDHGAGTPP